METTGKLKLADKGALITGGSRGIGRAVARAFLEEGARIVIISRHRAELEETARELSQLGPCLALSGDVSREDEVSFLVQESLKKLGRIDILVNAAAVTGPIGPFFQNDLKSWRACLEINLWGTIYPIYYILPHFIARKRGKIINFSGGGATRGRKNFSAYATAKTAVIRLTEILALELKEFNIQVNAIAPGIVKTRMIEEIISAGPESAGQEYWDLLNRPENAFDPPELAARLAVFLASEEADEISGKLISARWDEWQNPETLRRMKEEADFFVLRRIDGREFEKND